MLCRIRMSQGGFTLHEHPAGASSWKEPCIKKLAQLNSIHNVTSHQCMYGLMAPSTAGDPIPAKTPTTRMTNSAAMANRRSKACNNKLPHQPLMNGRAKYAELYPKKLMLEIPRSMRDQQDGELLAKEEEEDEEEAFQRVALVHSGFGYPVDMPYAPSMMYTFARHDAAAAVVEAQLDLSYPNGKRVKHKIGQPFTSGYVDDYTGETPRRT